MIRKLFYFAIAIGIVFVMFGFPLMWAWNYTMVGLFHLHTINFWHACSMLLVAQILFKGIDFKAVMTAWEEL